MSDKTLTQSAYQGMTVPQMLEVSLDGLTRGDLMDYIMVGHNMLYASGKVHRRISENSPFISASDEKLLLCAKALQESLRSIT